VRPERWVGEDSVIVRVCVGEASSHLLQRRRVRCLHASCLQIHNLSNVDKFECPDLGHLTEIIINMLILASLEQRRKAQTQHSGSKGLCSVASLIGPIKMCNT